MVRPSFASLFATIMLTTWFKNFTWGPFALAYLMPLVVGIYTLGVAHNWAIVRGPSMLLTWVELITAQIILLLIGCAVVDDRYPERFRMALLHAGVGLVMCPAAILVVLHTLGVHAS